MPSRARLAGLVCLLGGVRLLGGVGAQLSVDHVGEPPAQAAHGLHRRLALGELAPVVGPARGVVADLRDAGHV